MTKNLRKGVGAKMQNSVLVALLAVVAVSIADASQLSKSPNYPTGEIESSYYKQGPWPDVCEVKEVNCGDTYRCDLYYPRNLDAGFQRPVLTWGNGALAKPDDYEFFLKHMASWGFVIIATEDKMTGTGQTMVHAVEFLKEKNDDPDPANVFYHKLDLGRVGSFGHSEGASGAINAMIRSPVVKTAVAIELPAGRACWGFYPFCTRTSKLTSGSIFLIDGSADAISPPFQPSWLPAFIFGPQSIEAYYEEAPNTVEKVKATLIGPDHNDVQGQPCCSKNTRKCVNGVFGYLGYPTAWMVYRLQGDIKAKAAFVRRTEHGRAGEIFSQPANWEYVASNLD